MSKTLTPACLISLTLIGCGPDYASVADGERRVVPVLVRVGSHRLVPRHHVQVLE